MNFWPALARVLLSFLLIGCLPGCFPKSGSNVDEQQEAYFLKGKSRINAMDYKGAIEAFEKALEANPNSASAHLELGLLFEQRENNYAAAIYHFEKHLALRPNSPVADLVQQRITACKLELAKTVSFALMSEQVQREIDRLNKENKSLRDQADRLKSELELALQAQTNAMRMASDNSISTPPAAQTSRSPANSGPPPSPRSLTIHPSPSIVQAHTPPASATTYTVRSGDTLFKIAQRHGLSVAELQSANPGVNPKKLRPGQTLRVPRTRR